MNLAINIRLAAILTIAIVAGCSSKLEMLELNGYTMGTSYSVKAVRSDTSVSLEPLSNRIFVRLEELESLFSTYRETSEISQFNAHVGNEWFEIPPVFLTVLMRGIDISELSGGAFDITVGPLVELWGFGASNSINAVPTQTEIDSMLKTTGFNYLEVQSSPPAVRRTQPGVRLDLSSIAKGFAVDEISALLDSFGLTSYMVEIGGEVRARGMRADGSNWLIGIETPTSKNVITDRVQDVVYLRDAAIATSGNYRNYFEYEGNYYSHTLDPRTGWPVSHGLTSVSVIEQSAMNADALATALMVLGPELGLDLATRENIAALLLLRTDGGLKILQTPAYKAYLANR
ncbi:MAG: FAD:protein FMN transferase [Pseudomonadota bacterium]|nr:FAD:protein FMN transferase [Pseudomonadota bacterium]